MIYPVNGLKLKLTAWNEQLMDYLETAPGWLDPAVVWFDLLEERLGLKHPETKKAAEKAFYPEIFCLIITIPFTGLIA